MIRAKQLDEIKRLRDRLGSSGTGDPPSLEHHVMIALVSGEVPKLKPIGTICGAARKIIIGDRYNGRSLPFGAVFASCNGYKAEMKQWKDHEAKRKAALASFNRDAERIIVKAMDSEADASEIVEQLHDAAQRSGLNALKAPVFEEKD